MIMSKYKMYKVIFKVNAILEELMLEEVQILLIEIKI